MCVCDMYLIAQCRGRVWVETINVLFQLLHRRRPYNRATGFYGNSVDVSKGFFNGTWKAPDWKHTCVCQYDCVGYPTEMDVYMSYFTSPLYIVKYNGFPLTSLHTTCSCTRWGRVRPAWDPPPVRWHCTCQDFIVPGKDESHTCRDVWTVYTLQVRTLANLNYIIIHWYKYLSSWHRHRHWNRD